MSFKTNTKMYYAVYNDSTVSFRKRHLVSPSCISSYAKMYGIPDDEEWFAVNFKYSSLYSSVEAECKTRFDEIACKGHFLINGLKMSVHTVVLRVDGERMTVVYIRKIGMKVRLEYVVEDVTNMKRNTAGKLVHYEGAPYRRYKRHWSYAKDNSSDESDDDSNNWFDQRMKNWRQNAGRLRNPSI